MAKSAAKNNPVAMTPDSEPEQAAVEAVGTTGGSSAETNNKPSADVESSEVKAVSQSYTPSSDPPPTGTATQFLKQANERANEVHVVATVVAVSVPIQRVEPGSGGHLSMKVEVRLTHAQARLLKGVYNALHLSGARRASGQHVDKLSHAVQWLLDQLEVSPA